MKQLLIKIASAKAIKWIIDFFRNLFQNSEVITKEIGEAFEETSDVFGKINELINSDEKIKQNSIAELIQEAKEARVEWKDVIVVITPKKSKAQ
jgi:uncharacterized protein YdcH (DUF465 family)